MAPRGKTLKELAEHLDVSITTVSRALADHPTIALKTRQRVAEAAKAHGYVPNVAARQLVSGRSGFVGLILPIRGPNFVDSYVGEFITGLGEGLVAHGVDLFLATAQPGQSELSVLKHVVESGRADGIVLPRIAEDDERVAYLVQRGFPFVTHGRLLDETRPVNWLDTDSVAAFGEAFDLLYELGHRHFGLVSISDRMTFRYLRERGLREAIARRGDPTVTLDVATAPRFDRGASVAAINGMLRGAARPTAILGLFDELALTVLEEAARAGLSIPRDLSVVGFDNITAAAYAPPGLTTFEAGTRAAGREIGGMLIDIIETRPAKPLTRLIKPTFVPRASHGPAPVETH
ncbi:LacI family DNA-binding transcriptional regulator [Devosia ginsengisoli]|uniref:LacI family DNA-binding transcriptional regulator n=1 Tax=Devosia ginsengisoli TaxID=400770 RepID=UPI0026EB6032|nr:substrate-binding domain-containing protein [Devosia ginsengisoli]MCR6670532.1 substrate-binding domain-containing protein [Devosia ginsengisoli]